MQSIVLAPCRDSSVPWLIMKNIMQTPHFLITPLFLMNKFERLQRVIIPRQWVPFPFEECREEILVRESKSVELFCSIQIFDECAIRFLRWVDNHSPRIELRVRSWRRLCRNRWRVPGRFNSSVRTVDRDPGWVLDVRQSIKRAYTNQSAG